MSGGARTGFWAGNTRWWVLAIVALAQLGNFYTYDSIAPLADLLQRERGFTDVQLGALNAIYSLPNVFLVLVGGLLIDRFGAARVMRWTATICLVGAVLTAWADGFGAMALGRLLFGTGSETFLIASLVPCVRWFSGGTVAFAMAILVSLGRVGSYGADLSPTLVRGLYERGSHAPLWFAAALSAVTLIMVLIYGRVEDAAQRRGALGAPPASERIVWSDVLRFGRAYWSVVALCVLFYGAIMPFRSTFAIKFFQHVEGLSLQDAGLMNSHVFLAAIFVTPLFGWISDRVGRRATLLVGGALLLVASFVTLATVRGALWPVTVMIGISYSLVPAVLWPAVSFLVEQRRLGTAYGLMTMLQNAGLAIANLAAGAFNDAGAASAANPAGYLPMLWFFVAVSGCGLLAALALRVIEAGPRGHGLEAAGST